mgnify:CR=1 FL=1
MMKLPRKGGAPIQPSGDDCADLLPQYGISDANHAGFSYVLVLQQDFFNLVRTDPIAAGLDHFVVTPCDGQIAVGIQPSQISGMQPSILEDSGG